MYALPILTNVLGKSFHFGFGIQTDHWVFFFGVFIIGTLLSGLYPALVLSGFKPAIVIKGAPFSRRKFGLRQVLVTAQLMIGIFLIAGTYAVHRQLRFMLNQDLGLDVKQVVSITGPMVYEDKETLKQKTKLFQEKLRALSDVTYVSGSHAVPGGSYNWGTEMTVDGNESVEEQAIRLMFVDDQFRQTYGLELIAGRFHNTDLQGEQHQVVVNETLVKKFNLGTPKEAIGKRNEKWQYHLPYYWSAKGLPLEIAQAGKNTNVAVLWQ